MKPNTLQAFLVSLGVIGLFVSFVQPVHALVTTEVVGAGVVLHVRRPDVPLELTGQQNRR